MKGDIHARAMKIIYGRKHNSPSIMSKNMKDMNSTVTGSVEQSFRSKKSKSNRTSVRSTPKEFTIDLRNFTFGERAKGSSDVGKREGKVLEPHISEFSLDMHGPSMLARKTATIKENPFFPC